MRSADTVLRRARRGAVAALLACAAAAPALAGGPLYVVPVNGVMKPVRWSGTVRVYLDVGNLNVGMNCIVDENYNCVLDEAGNPLFNSWPRYRLGRGKLVSCRWTLDDVRARQASGRPLNGLYASGGSIAARRDRFRELGGFLPIYRPYYSEDMDLGTRAWMRGWATRCVPESRIVHPGGGTIKRLFRARRVRATRIRNQLIYLALYTPPGELLTRHLPWILGRALMRLLRLDTTMLVGLAQAVARAREIAATRARIRASQPYKTLAELLEDIAAR